MIQEGKERAIYNGNRDNYWRNRVINSLRSSRQKKIAQNFLSHIRKFCYFEHNEYNWQNLPMILKYDMHRVTDKHIEAWQKYLKRYKASDMSESAF